MNNFMKIAPRIKTLSSMSTQSGVALLISIVVMLALTVLALAATNSNQTQAFMVRNAQFRLETFNASFTEIDGQIDFINERPIADGIPEVIAALIDSPPGTDVNTDGTGAITAIDLEFQARAELGYMDQQLSKAYRAPCAVTGSDLGEGVARIRCDEIIMTSSATLINSGDVRSDQNQSYEYRSLNEI